MSTGGEKALSQFRLVAFLEGCSFLLLGVTMILKYKYSMPQPNYVVGMAHGLLFIAYVFLLARVAYIQKWPLIKVSLSFLASLVPFGTFYADKKIFRSG
jgi:integral membrane protein